jgi:hypothetical protein
LPGVRDPVIADRKATKLQQREQDHTHRQEQAQRLGVEHALARHIGIGQAARTEYQQPQRTPQRPLDGDVMTDELANELPHAGRMQHRFLATAGTEVFAKTAIASGAEFRRSMMGGAARRRRNVGGGRQRMLSAEKTEC